MSVRAHGHQVATLSLDPFDDLLDRLAISQFRVGWDSSGLKLRPHFFQIGRVLGDLAADGIRSVGARRPTVRHMQQHDAAVGELGQFLDMLDDGPVRWRSVQASRE